MPLPPVRFTVRWLMVVVLVLAVSLGLGLTMYRRQQIHLRWATFCASQQNRWASLEGGDAILMPDQSIDETHARARILAPYFAGLMREFRRAAIYPWLSVRLDPAMIELTGNRYLLGARGDLPPPTLPEEP